MSGGTNVKWLPTTSNGRMASWLLAGFVLLVGLNLVAQALLESPGGDQSWLERGIIWLAGGVALAAAVVAAIAVARDKERAVVVYLAFLPVILVVGLNAGSLLASVGLPW